MDVEGSGTTVRMPTGQREPPVTRSRSRPIAAAVAAAVLVPTAVLALLRLQPALDVLWRSEPAHFWLVLGASAIATALGYSVAVAARRRRDARLFVVSLAFLAAAGFLGLHGLATPGVLVGANGGFELATPVGLVLGGVLVALSAVDFTPATAGRIMAGSRWILLGLAAVVGLWAGVSLTGSPPLDDPLQQEVLQGWQVLFGVVGILGYGTGAAGYLRLYARRRARLLLAFGVAAGLLAAALVVVVFAVNWQLSWWEWHVLMLMAFGLIATAAHREWHEERFSALYLEQTLRGTREASVMFADLQGFTAFSERSSPAEVHRLLNAYFSRLVPLLQDHGGDVHQLIGDAVMVVFNKNGDQPDHARLAAGAALAFQAAAADLASGEPGWPRFRVGVNSGEVAAGVTGERGYRTYDVVGDTVNLASRLESQAPVGAVVIGEGTYAQLPPETVVEALPPLALKGKSEPVTAYVLRRLAG